MNKNKSENIDEYIANYPEDIQEILQQIRETIHAVAPDATETISYMMPAFKLHTPLVYFAVCKNHIGFYPTGSGIEAFKNEFGDYKYSKGAVQFPIDKPMPLDLIARIVRFRVKDDIERAEKKKLKKEKK